MGADEVDIHSGNAESFEASGVDVPLSKLATCSTTDSAESFEAPGVEDESQSSEASGVVADSAAGAEGVDIHCGNVESLGAPG